MKLFDSTLGQLERALDARLLNQNVLAGNLANLDTPGFTPQQVDFARALSAQQDSPGGPVGLAVGPDIAEQVRHGGGA